MSAGVLLSGVNKRRDKMSHHHKKQSLVIPIATPLAGHRLTKKIGGVMTQACNDNRLVYGVKDTCKAIRAGKKGILVLGANVTPMDIITHIPGLAEEADMPYIYFPTKEHISAYANRTNPVACCVILEPTDETALAEYQSVLEDIAQAGTQAE